MKAEKLYTVEEVNLHREQAFIAGRITEAQSIKASYASKTYNPQMYYAINKRIKRYKNKIEKIKFGS